MTSVIPASAFLIPRGDCDDHGSLTGSGYKEANGGCGYGKSGGCGYGKSGGCGYGKSGGCGYGKSDPIIENARIMENALAYDLLLGNTCLKKRDSHLITYRSCSTAFQVALFAITNECVHARLSLEKRLFCNIS